MDITNISLLTKNEIGRYYVVVWIYVRQRDDFFLRVPFI